MSEPVVVYRVSNRFLANLWAQAFYGACGVLLSWLVFWMLSLSLCPPRDSIGIDDWLRAPQQTMARLESRAEMEITRTFLGPSLVLLVLFGGLIDYSTWGLVRYEAGDTTFIMRWPKVAREIKWDVINAVHFRDHAQPHLQSATLTATGTPPVLIRGVSEMPVLMENVREKISPKADWPTVPSLFDLTSPPFNLAAGLLLPIPFHATWLASYYWAVSTVTLMLFWSWLLIPVAIAIWYWRPMSRRHMCAVEVEVAMAGLLAVLSGFLTLESSLDSGAAWWTQWVF